MEDQSNPRVQAHAAAALINFTEDCPKSLLIPYLDSLVQHLHVIMVAKLQEVQIFLNFKKNLKRNLVVSLKPAILDPAAKMFNKCRLLPFQLIQKGTKLVLEQVVTSIASVADTAEEKFVPYYDLFMPSLKHIVENAVQKELRLLRGKTIECISLIGLAVGKEKVCAATVIKLSTLLTGFTACLCFRCLHSCSLISVLVHARCICCHAAAP